MVVLSYNIQSAMARMGPTMGPAMQYNSNNYIVCCISFSHSGGHDGEGLLDTVERYDPQRDTWTVITTLSSPRCLGSLVALKGCLYAIGGYDGASVLQSLQVRDLS